MFKIFKKKPIKPNTKELYEELKIEYASLMEENQILKQEKKILFKSLKKFDLKERHMKHLLTEMCKKMGISNESNGNK